MKKAQLRIALSDIAARLVAEGFEEKQCSSPMFVRARGPFLDMVCFVIGKSRSSVQFIANVWTPFADAGIDLNGAWSVSLNSFPRLAGGHVTPTGVGEWGPWSAESDADLASSIVGMTDCLERHVFAWFAQIVDGESYTKACRVGNPVWWRTVRQVQRDFIRSSIDDALRGEIEIKPFVFS